MVAELQAHLEPAIDNVLNTLRHYGLTPFAAPHGALFMSAGFPMQDDEVGARPSKGSEITRLTAYSRRLLIPGHMFISDKISDPPWFRFNVAWIDHPSVRQFFKSIKR